MKRVLLQMFRFSVCHGLIISSNPARPTFKPWRLMCTRAMYHGVRVGQHLEGAAGTVTVVDIFRNCICFFPLHFLHQFLFRF